MNLYSSKPKHFKFNECCHTCEYQTFLKNCSVDNNYWCNLHSFIILDNEVDRFKCEDWEVERDE